MMMEFKNDHHTNIMDYPVPIISGEQDNPGLVEKLENLSKRSTKIESENALELLLESNSIY